VIVTGHQFWWEVEYDDPDVSRRLRTANEIHIPVGRPVQLDLASRDVIHSFWVPAITGKKDLIPGYRNTEVLLADKPDLYIGQCAEFCGLQHAKMNLQVYAEPPEKFKQWWDSQLQSAPEPANDLERRGRDVFTQSSCVLCHSIQGTPAGATIGPDLTHLASRKTIAAGSLPNTPGNLASWIRSPQTIKPGAQMPATALPPDDLAALTQYLTSLR
jgi:cytochrome c oxidase subunit II